VITLLIKQAPAGSLIRRPGLEDGSRFAGCWQTASVKTYGRSIAIAMPNPIHLQFKEFSRRRSRQPFSAGVFRPGAAKKSTE